MFSVSQHLIYILCKRHQTSPLLISIWFTFYTRDIIRLLCVSAFDLHSMQETSNVSAVSQHLIYILYKRHHTSPLFLSIWFIFYTRDIIRLRCFSAFDLHSIQETSYVSAVNQHLIYILYKRHHTSPLLISIWFTYYTRDIIRLRCSSAFDLHSMQETL